MSTCAAPSCSKPGTNKCSGCKITPNTCESFRKSNCWIIRTSSITPDADPEDDASYIEPLPLEEYGNWQAEIRELRRKIPKFQATEIGKFYSHKSEDIWWYYYVYGSIRGGPQNKVTERCVGRRVNDDVAVVKSGPEEASNYPDEFTRTDLVKTAAFYHTEGPSKVYGEAPERQSSMGLI
ncbi:hypothetical protein BJX65DRAFT_305960 [Aspergillus insuetus]